MVDPKKRTPPSVPFHPDADLSKLAKKLTPEQVRERLRKGPVDFAAALNVPNPPNAAAGLTPNAMIDGMRDEIPLSKIRVYDHNPRRASNDAFEVIKNSLRATGRDSLELWVTKRPGEDWYMPYRGGNTRLVAIQQLFKEGDARWERIKIVYKVWISEADTLTQHLIENTNRAGMTFWDKANAYLVEMRAEIEREAGGSLSVRQLEKELEQRGIGIKKSLISLFQFAVLRLAKIGPYLSATQVIQMQPALNLMARLAEKLGLDETGFQAVLDAVLAGQRTRLEELDSDSDPDSENKVTEGGIRADALLPAVEAALAERLGAATSEMRRWLETLGRFPDISEADLRNTGTAPPPAKPPGKSALPSTSPTQASPGPKEEEASPGSAMSQANPISNPGSTPETVTESPLPATDEAGEQAAPLRPSRQAYATPTGTPLDAVRALANAAYVADCLRETPVMPAGYYMEIPESPIDVNVDADCSRPSHRIIAWQLLAALSGQWDGATCRKLATDSLWRRMRLCEGGLDANALPMLMQDQLLVDSCGHCIAGADDIGWGPSVGMGWVVALMTDPLCADAASTLFHQFTIRGQV